MMPGNSVIIWFTGLVLFSPARQAGGPMHVLFPKELAGMEKHVVQIGMKAASGSGCDAYVGGVCYYNIENSTIEFGRTNYSHSGSMRGANVSRTGAQERVNARYLVPVLQNSSALNALKARISLFEGSNEYECPLARFEFRQTYGSTVIDSIDVTNVVRWSYKITTPSIQMTRRNFRGTGPSSRTWTLTPNTTHAIELYVRHIPESQAVENPPPEPDLQPGEYAEHFKAYYPLLGNGTTSPTLPRFGRKLNNLCDWHVTKRKFFLDDTAGTMSCMVAAGLPPP